MTKPDNYSNWDSFAPVIESGIDILLQALNKTVGATCFDSVSIRYDDWFPTEITGRDSSHFIRDVLGFSIALPDRIDEGFPSKGDESVQAYVNRHLAGCGLDATIKVADMTRIAGRPADPVVQAWPDDADLESLVHRHGPAFRDGFPVGGT